ncbi:MAG: efflux RND transporter periplasmic adaptor subunit [Nibricoccus sp.]
MKKAEKHFEFPRLLVLCALAGGLFAGGCKPAASAPKGPPSVPVRTAKALTQTVPITIDAVGTVEALRTVALKSQVDGQIAEVHFREGDEVKAGDSLLTLDRRPLEASLALAKAELAQAQAQATKASADLERNQQLENSGAVSHEAFAGFSAAAASATAVVAAKEAALTRAQLNLEYSNITAPIAGRTSRLALREGSLVKANDSAPLLTINQLAPIAVAFSLPESALPAVRSALAAGPVVASVSPGDSGHRIEGRIDFLDNAVNTETGTITLRAVFENQDSALWPGQFVNVVLKLGEQHDAVIVPTAAVQVGQQGSQIFFVKADNKVEVRTVKTGRTSGDNIVILSGATAGETVVTDGQLQLLPGITVSVKEPKGAKSEAAGTKKQEKPKS